MLHLNTALISGTNQLKFFLWPTDITDNPDGAYLIMGSNETMAGSRFGVIR